MKKRFKILTILLFLAILFTSLKVEASTNKYVYLGGDSIGIKMNTGVYVVGKYQVQNGKTKISPWEKSDIQNGDRIDSINGIKITNNAQLQKYIKETNASTLKLKVKRGDKVFQTQINVVENNNQEKTIGLYIRDQILGIGTLTFITDDSKFASLGHGIYENKILVNTTSGNLYTSNVQTIKKSEPGSAGEKRASLDNQIIGKIIFNDVTGLYGTINHINQKKQMIEMASQDEVKTGKAQIYTVISGNKIEAFDVEITEVKLQANEASKGIKLKVIDQGLLSKTGGIVQGMSGSPIVQNGKLIGAVSHVTLDNPVYGYGMHIEFMNNKVNTIK